MVAKQRKLSFILPGFLDFVYNIFLAHLFSYGLNLFYAISLVYALSLKKFDSFYRAELIENFLRLCHFRKNYFLYFLNLSSASFRLNFSVMLSISLTESPLPIPNFCRNFTASTGPSSLYRTEIPFSNKVVCTLPIFRHRG